MQVLTNSSKTTFKKSVRALTSLNQRDMSTLIHPREFSRYVSENKPIIIHASSLPNEKKAQIYHNERVPGAREFDIDAISAKNIDVARMLPVFNDFVEHMKRLGINASDEVLAYDDEGIKGATRAIWMLNVFGNDNARMIEGGFNLYKELKKPVEMGEETWIDSYHKGGEGFVFKRDLMTDMIQVREFISGRTQNTELVDARSEAEFRGETTDGGHIPSSKNVPVDLLLEPNHTFKKPQEIEKVFQGRGVDLGKRIICSSSTGMSSTVLYVALKLLGKHDVSVYDGSWAEWSKFPANEIVKILLESSSKSVFGNYGSSRTESQ